MNRNTAVLVTALVIIGAVGAVPSTGLAASDPGVTATQSIDGQVNQASLAQNDSDENASDLDENASEVAAGAVLTGVIGVQEAELDGELESRTFGIKMARAASNDSKADVVGEQLTSIQERLETLQERKAELDAARANGSISESRYRAGVAEVAARTETVKRLANETEGAAGELPADLLERKGINASAIRTLKQDAANMTGPEVAAIAQSIGGPDVGTSVARDEAPAEVGPSGDRGADNRSAAPGDDGDRQSEAGNGTDRSRATAADGGVDDRSQGNTTAGDDGVDRTDGGERDGTRTAAGPDDRDGERTATPTPVGGDGDGSGDAGDSEQGDR